MKKQGREKNDFSKMGSFPMPALLVWYNNPLEGTQKSIRPASK
jgi:hypothetical protein